MQIVLFLLVVLFAQNQGSIESDHKSYNEIYSSRPGEFSHEPNSFLVCATQSLKPNRALDERLAVISKSAEDWNRGDIEAFVRSYEQTPETTFVGATVVHGAEDILARYRRSYPDRARMGKLTFSELQARSLSPSLAIVTGRFTLDRAANAGGRAAGIFTLVMRRGPDGWRIIHDHTSPQ